MNYLKFEIFLMSFVVFRKNISTIFKLVYLMFFSQRYYKPSNIIMINCVSLSEEQ